jgi:serine/threonine protein kinase
MEKLGMLPPAQGLHLGISLSNALEHLHRQQLIHRDIKPPNIIYVNGVPKFADIGLVTDIAGDPKDISQIGTEGYMAPEGPGTPTADVYSLGKVLYEAVMGRDRRMFPEVPTAVFEQPADSLVRRFNEIIFRACEENPARRYATARELYDALCQLAAEQANR